MLKKRGRPKKVDAKTDQYRVRLGSDDLEMLNYLCKKTKMDKAELFRNGIKIQYNLQKCRE